MKQARKWHRGDPLVLASHNPGKQREIAALLAPFAVETISASKLGLAEPEETGATFLANAELKAQAASLASGLPALSDDSGLAVWGLGGQPGIHSARWAGRQKDFTAAMQRIERDLSKQNREDRSCTFFCALALCWPDGEMCSFEGRAEGSLVFPPRGDKGFGYDPIVQPLRHDRTFAEMDPEEKHALSHRTRAFEQLVAAVFAFPRLAS